MNLSLSEAFKMEYHILPWKSKRKIDEREIKKIEARQNPWIFLKILRLVVVS